MAAARRSMGPRRAPHGMKLRAGRERRRIEKRAYNQWYRGQFRPYKGRIRGRWIGSRCEQGDAAKQAPAGKAQAQPPADVWARLWRAVGAQSPGQAAIVGWFALFEGVFGLSSKDDAPG